jgi:hypothetical protein
MNSLFGALLECTGFFKKIPLVNGVEITLKLVIIVLNLVGCGYSSGQVNGFLWRAL